MRVIRWVLLLLVIAGLSRITTAFNQDADTADLLKTADDMVRTVAKIRGLEPKGEIKKGVKSRAEIVQFLNEKAREEHSRTEFPQEQKLLRKLGLIPATMDLKDYTLKLLGEQVGGFYDPAKKTLFIASWLPVEEQKPVMAHEIAHALQDQYFDVESIMNRDRELHNDDEALAHLSLMEGDSSVVMVEYLSKRNLGNLPDLAYVMHALMFTTQSQNPVFKSAPPYLQESLMFPYGSGAAFVQKAWAKEPSWRSIDKIYSDLPVSTEQILHPEKYFAHDNPKPVKQEELTLKLKNWKATYKNVMGEFSLDLLLSTRLSEERARRSVVGWGGDEVILLENTEGKDAVFINTIWDSMEEADIFYLAIQEWLHQSYPKARKLNESPDGFSLVQDGEFHSLRRDGTSIRFLIGLPEADGQKLDKI
jgi:hypothetical protein